jgi:hypothetical protein
LFVAARRPFLAELGSIARRRSLDPDRLAGIYDQSSGLLDRLLLRLVAAHENESMATGTSRSAGPSPVSLQQRGA